MADNQGILSAWKTKMKKIKCKLYNSRAVIVSQNWRVWTKTTIAFQRTGYFYNLLQILQNISAKRGCEHPYPWLFFSSTAPLITSRARRQFQVYKRSQSFHSIETNFAMIISYCKLFRSLELYWGGLLIYTLGSLRKIVIENFKPCNLTLFTVPSNSILWYSFRNS